MAEVSECYKIKGLYCTRRGNKMARKSTHYRVLQSGADGNSLNVLDTNQNAEYTIKGLTETSIQRSAMVGADERKPKKN